MTRLRAAALAIALICALAGAPAASAAPTRVGGLRWQIKLARALSDHLFQDCFLTSGLGWQVSSGWGTAPIDPAKGSWDPVGRSGTAIGRSKAILFDSLTQRQNHTGHAWQMDNVGIELKGRRAYITAQLHSARSLLVAARRRRIAVIARPKLRFGTGHSFSRRGTDLGIQPNSFVMSLSGRAKITKAFLAATRRWRCKGRFANFERAHVRAGEALGNVTLALGALEATGLGGEVVLERAEFIEEENGDPITITAAAPATKKRALGETALHFPIAGLANTPLKCNLGATCTPTGGGAALAGGFTLGFNGRSTTIASVAIAWQVDADGFLRHTITGTVDGQPMTIATGNGPAATDEFLARIGEALGVKVTDRTGGIDPQFTSTGPA